MVRPGSIYENKPDGVRIRADADGTWDVSIRGRHTRGKEATQEAGLAAAEQVYQSYVLEIFAKGNPLSGGRWICSLG